MSEFARPENREPRAGIARAAPLRSAHVTLLVDSSKGVVGMQRPISLPALYFPLFENLKLSFRDHLYELRNYVRSDRISASPRRKWHVVVFRIRSRMSRNIRYTRTDLYRDTPRYAIDSPIQLLPPCGFTALAIYGHKTKATRRLVRWSASG